MTFSKEMDDKIKEAIKKDQEQALKDDILKEAKRKPKRLKAKKAALILGILIMGFNVFSQEIETKESIEIKVQHYLKNNYKLITPNINMDKEIEKFNNKQAEKAQKIIEVVAPPPVCDINELTQRIGELYAECIGYIHPDSCVSQLVTLGEYSRWWVYWQSDTPDACGKYLTWFEPVKAVTCGNFQRQHAITAVDPILEWWPPIARDTCGMHKE